MASGQNQYLFRMGLGVLVLALVVLLGASQLDHRASGGAMASGEATALMQARSLLEDGDLAYERQDFDRFLLHWGTNPTDLELASGSDGKEITFDRPVPHALLLVPFLSLWPRQGFAVAHASLLLGTLLFVALAFRRRGDDLATWWILVATFASVLPAYVFLASGDLFLFCVTLVAFTLVTGEPRHTTLGGLVAGGLLAIPVMTQPLFLVLPFVAWRLAEEPAVRRGVLQGIAGGVLALGLVHWWCGGGLFGMGMTSFRFRPETGYPLVDFSSLEWAPTLHRLSAIYWDGAPRFSWGLEPGLWLWDSIYLLVGRSIGLLPYFLPAALLLALGSGRKRKLLALGVGLWALGSILLFPFDLHGGEGAVANRRFLPIYGMLWILAAMPRPLLGRRKTAAALAITALLSAPFLHKVWSRPWAPPVMPGEGYHHVSAFARTWLPFETSQKWMPGGALESYQGLRIKFFDENAWHESQRRRLKIEGPKRAELMIVVPERVDSFYLAFDNDAPASLEVEGADLGDRVLEAGGGVGFRVLPRWAPRHGTWWTPRAQRFYHFTIQLPGAEERPLAFQLAAEREAEPAEARRKP